MRVLEKKIDVSELLPQQHPFVMVDKLSNIDEKIVTTNLCIRQDNIFVEHGKFTEPGIIENIAQTGAVRMGYMNKYVYRGELKLGFIGEIKNLVVERLPCLGDKITTTVEIKNEVLSTLLVHAHVTMNNKIIASCDMKIHMTEIGVQV